MKNKIPLAYVLYRGSWSAIHAALLLLAFGALIIWFATDGQGPRVVNGVWASLTGLQQTVSGVIPFPWGG